MIYEYEDLVNLHLRKFGVKPVVTGKNFYNPEVTIQGIADALETDEPYSEGEISEKVDF